MRDGWDCKKGAAVLGIAPQKFTQAADPAFEKIARLLLADPLKTYREIIAVMDRIEAERAALEVHRRETMLDGRLTRAVLHPTRS